MKKNFLVLTASLSITMVNAQSNLIEEVFKLLPSDKVYDLTVATRDSMLRGKTYYPADNDSTEIIAYNLGYSTTVKNYLFVSLSFETQQRATGMIEIRSFKMMNGNNMILVSQSGGVWGVAYNQQELSAFTYRKDKKLIPYRKKVLPEPDESIFLKPETPDSIKKQILNNSNMAFDLSEEKIMLGLNSPNISGNKTFEKWLKGDVVYFDWINDRFVISKMEFQ